MINLFKVLAGVSTFAGKVVVVALGVVVVVVALGVVTAGVVAVALGVVFSAYVVSSLVLAFPSRRSRPGVEQGTR